MISVSNKYKEIMSRPVRNRAFISVGIGIINQNAQASGKANGNFAYWSYGSIFDANQSRIEYATLEENFMKTDGNMIFMPENDELMQLQYNGVTTDALLGTVRIDFPQIYAVKGITLVFSSAYPTSFTLQTAEKTLTYSNNSEKFETNDVLGDTNYILITPLSMSGGQQRFRIKSVLIGVGLQYYNQQTKSFSLDEYVSPISEDLPSENMSYSFYDEENYFNVDDESSFVGFLETLQKITVSFGLELDNGDVEWRQIATQYLKDWKSQKDTVSLSATDRLSQMEDEYTLANRIYERTAYTEAQNIFSDAGLEPDEYYIDEYLQDITLNNPMPVGTHKECLQILANACRCIIRQDENGIINILANFALVLAPSDLTITTNGVADWSKPGNVMNGAFSVYADMTKNFIKADGSMYFMPEDADYLETSYVSEQISDSNGLFEVNPTLTISMPASYTYFNLNISFDGNPPTEMIVHTYKSDALITSVEFDDLQKENFLVHEFSDFDTMKFEFTKGYPNNRILVNRISFSNLSDFMLTKSNMVSQPTGYKEKRTKEVRCKVFSYTTDENGTPKEVEDNVYVTKTLGNVGEIKTIQNPLVGTQAHAALLAEWIGNYYSNNVSYSVDYRGDPRNNAADIIHMESDVFDNLQVEIEKHSLKFGGAFSGSMELRRASKTTGD